MYIGPETLMPLASLAAGIAGAVLLFWRRTVTVAKAGRDLLLRTMLRFLERT